MLGLLLLGWLFSYMRHPDWDDGPVEILVTVYFFAAQMVPLFFLMWFGVRFNMRHKRSVLEGKRTAVLQHRGLFDFVSPFVVFLAVLSYVLFAAFVMYLRQHPFPGFAGFINLVGVTLVYASQAIVVYLALNLALGKLDLQRWEPFALSTFFLAIALLASMGYAVPPRQPQST